MFIFLKKKKQKQKKKKQQQQQQQKKKNDLIGLCAKTCATIQPRRQLLTFK